MSFNFAEFNVTSLDIFSLSSIKDLIFSFISSSSLDVLLFSFKRFFSPSILVASSVTLSSCLCNLPSSLDNFSNLLVSSKYLESFLLTSVERPIISSSNFCFFSLASSKLLFKVLIS